jgi:transposase
VFHERTSVGLDVHARSIVTCAIDGVTGEMSRARLCPEPGEVVAPKTAASNRKPGQDQRQ